MALTRCVAMETIEHGIRINAVAPSLAVNPHLAKTSSDELITELASKEVYGRGAEPWEIANIILFLGLAVIVHLILRRTRVRRTGSQPTTGWALGLSVGGLIGMYSIYRVLEVESLSVISIATIGLIALVSPRGYALIFCRHGYDMLQEKRWRAALKTFVFVMLLHLSLVAAMFDPRTWIFIIPPLILAERKAQDWVWAAVPRPARRRLRRIWSDASRNKSNEEE